MMRAGGILLARATAAASRVLKFMMVVMGRGGDRGRQRTSAGTEADPAATGRNRHEADWQQRTQNECWQRE
jgi:hypothetical protein